MQQVELLRAGAVPSLVDVLRRGLHELAQDDGHAFDGGGGGADYGGHDDDHHHHYGEGNRSGRRGDSPAAGLLQYVAPAAAGTTGDGDGDGDGDGARHVAVVAVPAPAAPLPLCAFPEQLRERAVHVRLLNEALGFDLDDLV